MGEIETAARPGLELSGTEPRQSGLELRQSGLELRIPTEAELRRAYREDFETAFPPDELKPLSSILRSWRQGTYQPWCLYDGGSGPIGECFLWLGKPGWALLDYLCVTAGWRNDGFGTWMLEHLGTLGPWACVLGECEAPEYAPDPALAERRMRFYLRSGARLAGYDTDLFGVRYRTLYWADRPLDDETLSAEHRNIYRLPQMPEHIRGLFQIPCTGRTAGGGNPGHGGNRAGEESGRKIGET